MDVKAIRAKYEDCKKDNDQLKNRINPKVDAMFAKTEQQYEELQKKKETTL